MRCLLFCVHRLLLAVSIVESQAKWIPELFSTRPNFSSLYGVARIAFDVLHQDICYNSYSEVCVEFSWSCYESPELTRSDISRQAKVPRVARWYFVDIESDRDAFRFEMHKATSMNPTARLRPSRKYTSNVYTVFEERVTLLRNFTFKTVAAAPSPVRQLTVEVLNQSVAFMPCARKLNVSWYAPQDVGANTLSGYIVGLYKKPAFSFRLARNKNLTISESATNLTWHVISLVNFYERKLFVKVVPYNTLDNGSLVYGQESVADVYLRSQYSKELAVNSVGSQTVDIEIDQDIFKDIIDAGLVTGIALFVSPVEMYDEHLSWRATDFSRAFVEDRMKRKQIRAVYRVSPHDWNLRNAMDKQRPDYYRLPCFQGSSSRRKIVCSIGVDETCESYMHVEVCNAPLIENMNYTVFARAYMKKSNYLPEYDDSKPIQVNLHSVLDRFRLSMARNPHPAYIGHGSYDGWSSEATLKNRHRDSSGIYQYDRFQPGFDAGNSYSNRFDRYPAFRPVHRQTENRAGEDGGVQILVNNPYVPINIPEQP